MSRPGKNFLHYESKDVNFPMIVMLAGFLFLILGGTLLLGRFLDHFFSHFSPLHDEPVSSLAEMNRLPPEPRLQVNPPVDMVRLRDVENVLLDNYSWIDPAAGKVRIPITRAMAILAERGLPTRTQTKDVTP
jgi:hypothetical protein